MIRLETRKTTCNRDCTDACGIVATVEGDRVIKIGGDPDHPVYLTLDGSDPVPLEFGSTVAIRRAKETLPLAVLPDLSFFSVVRQKLKWSGAVV